MTATRPALRYHGGKWKLAPWLIQHFPAHRIYVEPFGGGCNVLLRKKPSYAEVYNDLDREVVNLFRVMRDNGQRLRELLYLTPFAKEEFHAAFYQCDDPIEQARRTIARSFMGFGSASVTEYKHNTRIGRPTTGFRANSNRSCTTPAHDWKNYPDAVPAIIDRLRGVVIDNKPALDVIAQHDSADTLFYCDPPYMAAARDKGVDYAHEMTDADHAALADALLAIKGMAVISGYPSALYDRWFHNWERIERAAFADGARARTEVIWLNPACAAALDRERTQIRMFA